MLSIGSKKYRSLQEQVAYNSEQIEEIKTYLDGLSIQDNVISLDSLRTLTPEELEIVNRPISFIIFGDEVFARIKSDATKIYFEKYLSIEDNAIITLASQTIEVTKSNGTTGLVLASVEIYSKTKADELLNEKANLSGADFTGPVTAQTLEQAQANWGADVTSFPNMTGATSTPVFCRIHQINAELHVVMLGKVTNETGSPISAYTLSYVYFTLPNAIASKIYDYLGNKVSDAIPNTVIVSSNVATAIKESRVDMSKYVTDVIFFVVNNTPSNSLGMVFSRSTQITLNDGETIYLEGRVSLDLL